MTAFLKKVASLLPKRYNVILQPVFDLFLHIVHAAETSVRILAGKARRILWPLGLPKAAEGFLVNVGCGATDHAKFINVDAYPYAHVHYIHRIDRLPMFSDASVDLIYASHCLEHFKYRDIDRVLGEWACKLKPRGVLRLSVPDFDRFLAIYADTGNPDDFIEQLMGGQDNSYNYHYALFNKQNLTSRLVRAGFEDVREWVPGGDDLTTFDDFSVYHKIVAGKKYAVSLNLEARKALSQ